MATTSFTNLGGPIEVAIPSATGSLLLPPSADGRVRFSRDAYHQLGELGILPPDARFELIEGEIYMMSPIGAPQGGIITRLMNFFVTRLPAHLSCRVQLSISIGNDSEPEPDLAIVNRREDDYIASLPISSDVALLIEVAQSSLEHDLDRKLRMYAEAKIAEYWVVDVEHAMVLVHRQPAGSAYHNMQQIERGKFVAPLAAPECQLDVAWLFR
jgi:Uma2 family endonuclease